VVLRGLERTSPEHNTIGKKLGENPMGSKDMFKPKMKKGSPAYAAAEKREAGMREGKEEG